MPLFTEADYKRGERQAITRDGVLVTITQYKPSDNCVFLGTRKDSFGGILGWHKNGMWMPPQQSGLKTPETRHDLFRITTCNQCGGKPCHCESLVGL